MKVSYPMHIDSCMRYLVETMSTLGSSVYLGHAPVTLVLPLADRPNRATPLPSVTAVADRASKIYEQIQQWSMMYADNVKLTLDSKLSFLRTIITA